tara:strand:- start:11730 stop:12746 length:1017 start_codon:yes stop_codon:yes gene_type:complete
VVLPDPGGSAVDLSHQTIAGRPLVLWSVTQTGNAARADQLAGLLTAFEAVEARVFAVAAGKDAAIIETLEAAGVPQLVDEARSVAQAFGLGERSGLIVVAPGGCITMVDASAGFQDALNLCQELFDATDPSLPLAHAPVLVIENAFDPQTCRDLIDMWEAGQKLENAVAAGEAGQADTSLKRRSDVHVADRALYERLGARITSRVFPEIERAFQAKMASFELPRVGCYESAAQGFFGRHRDNRTPYTAHRLFAMTVNLNTGDYEGGELRFPEFGRQLYQPGPGGAVVFSCSLLHEALPVTSGRRFGLFSFFTDGAGAKREQELIAREKAKGRGGVRQT